MTDVPPATAATIDARRRTPILPAIVIAGCICRIVQYAWRRSYWHDEAYLILNVRHLSYAELFGALPNAQAAPPAFLVMQKWLGSALGGSEYAYRLLPLLLGLLGVILMAIVARRMLNPLAALCATALFAFSDRLIWHASEAKQYSGDATVALLMLLIVTQPRWSISRRLYVSGIASALLVWWSHPVVFVYGGIALALFVELVSAPRLRGAPAVAQENAPDMRGAETHPRRLRAILTLALSSIPALLSFAALYAISIRHQQQTGLYDYWSDHLPAWSRPWSVPLWIAKDTLTLPNYSFEIVGPAICAVTLAGAWTLWCERRNLLLLLAGPIVLTLLASLVERYPFGGTRLTLFLAPLVMLMAGAGFDGIARQLRSTRLAPVGRMLPIVLIGIGAMQAMYYLLVPRHRGHARPIVRYVLAHRAPGEAVYALSEVNSFLPYWDASPPPVPSSIDAVANAPAGRFWVIFAYADDDAARRAAMRALDADSQYREVDEFGVRGGAAFRFERERAPVENVAPSTRRQAGG